MPAIVLIIPVEARTTRIAWLLLSAIRMSPLVAMAIPEGLFSIALTAAPPSPLAPDAPSVPATTDVAPLLSTRLITCHAVSAKYMVPSGPTATPEGLTGTSVATVEVDEPAPPARFTRTPLGVTARRFVADEKTMRPSGVTATPCEKLTNSPLLGNLPAAVLMQMFGSLEVPPPQEAAMPEAERGVHTVAPETVLKVPAAQVEQLREPAVDE